MPINWKDLGSYERLLAAIVAAENMKVCRIPSEHALTSNFDRRLKFAITQVDYKRIAYFYGQGATYDSIEGRFRKAKKDAQALRDEVAGTAMPTSRSQPSTPRKTAAPRKKATPKSAGNPSSRKRKAQPDSDDSGVDDSEINDLRASATPSSRGKRAASKSAKYTFDSSHDDTAGEEVTGVHDDSLDELNDGQFHPDKEDGELKGTQDEQSVMEA